VLAESNRILRAQEIDDCFRARIERCVNAVPKRAVTHPSLNLHELGFGWGSGINNLGNGRPDRCRCAPINRTRARRGRYDVWMFAED
jgi:hypothetical protein